MDIFTERISKTQLAQILGGAFILPKGKLNSKKLRAYVCNILDLTELEYKESNVFTSKQIDALKQKKIIPTAAVSEKQ